jgi:hypothetical protein
MKAVQTIWQIVKRTTTNAERLETKSYNVTFPNSHLHAFWERNSWEKCIGNCRGGNKASGRQRGVSYRQRSIATAACRICIDQSRCSFRRRLHPRLLYGRFFICSVGQSETKKGIWTLSRRFKHTIQLRKIVYCEGVNRSRTTKFTKASYRRRPMIVLSIGE